MVDNLASLVVGMVTGLTFFSLGELVIMRYWGRRGMVYSLVGFVIFAVPIGLLGWFAIGRPWPAIFVMGFAIGALGWTKTTEKFGRVGDFYLRLLGKQEEHYLQRRGG